MTVSSFAKLYRPSPFFEASVVLITSTISFGRLEPGRALEARSMADHHDAEAWAT
jgi:hypothetical protein